MLSAMLGGPMIVGIVTCRSDSAVLLAASDDVAAEPAPATVDLAGAGAVRVVPIAAVGVLGGGAPEGVPGALEHGELGVSEVELVLQLPKSSNCDRPAPLIGHAVSSADFGTAAFGPDCARALAASSWRSARSAATFIAW